jgi:hypothetical protein
VGNLASFAVFGLKCCIEEQKLENNIEEEKVLGKGAANFTYSSLSHNPKR